MLNTFFKCSYTISISKLRLQNITNYFKTVLDETFFYEQFLSQHLNILAMEKHFRNSHSDKYLEKIISENRSITYRLRKSCLVSLICMCFVNYSITF